MEDGWFIIVILVVIAIRAIRNRMTESRADRKIEEIDSALFSSVFGQHSYEMERIYAHYLASKEMRRSVFYTDKVLRVFKDQRLFLEKAKEYEARVKIKEIVDLSTSSICYERTVLLERGLSDIIDSNTRDKLAIERVAYFSVMLDLDLSNETYERLACIEVINDKRLGLMNENRDPFVRLKVLGISVKNAYAFYAKEIPRAKKTDRYSALVSKLYANKTDFSEERAKLLLSIISEHIDIWLKQKKDKQL